MNALIVSLGLISLAVVMIAGAYVLYLITKNYEEFTKDSDTDITI